MRKNPVLLFDLGGVFVRSNGRIGLGLLAPSVAGDQAILDKWHATTAVSEFERGRCSSEEFAKSFIAEWGLNLGSQEFLTLFASWVEPYAGATKLIDNIRSKYRIACLSNTNSLHWERLNSMAGAFEKCVLSFQTGFMKPDPEAYLTAAEVLNVPCADIHFFDDLLVNVVAARDLGMTAHHVQGLDGVIRAMSIAGL